MYELIQICYFRDMNKSRLEAFSDGVFAIVITLLILNVRIPETDYEHLYQGLINLIPSLLSYVLSFFVIGLYWVFHHNSFQHVHKIDRSFVWMNMVLLLFISFMPFPTYLMGKYPFKEIPVIIYGFNLLAANLTGARMTFYIYKRKNLSADSYTAAVFKSQVIMYIVINLLYIIAIGIAFYNPQISYGIFVVVLILLILTTKSTKHRV